MSSRNADYHRDEDQFTAVRVVRNSGNSSVVSIPPNMLQGAGLAEGDEVSLVADIDHGTITISCTSDDEE